MGRPLYVSNTLGQFLDSQVISRVLTTRLVQ